MTARANAVRETADRILVASLSRLSAEAYDDVTLDKIAADAGVTVQTVIRRFGSKEGLVRGVVDAVRPQVVAQRSEAPVGDVAGAVANLVEHYEVQGDLALHLLRQDRTVPAYAEITRFGRQFHRDWVRRVFAPWLDDRAGVERARLLAQLVAVCDVYTWFLLRRQHGLSRRQTQLALVGLLEGVLR